MLNLERLCLAIAECEGWASPLETNTPGGSHSYRTNNPGNLRASPFSNGTVDNFAIFRTEADGWAALRWDIRQKARGLTVTGLAGSSTLADLIFVWAPASDKNTPSAYLASVCKMTGFSPDMHLSLFL